ncbi:unnamed protein product [Acanthosepion pharaonis]|uniref:Uncharacterized protein n=1 Tax=Acanthosepion pharaonis TaxID=158019 RepID=A0A812DI84_ACAPH|nr:unnamed protein product [Sepia pharaonis]
MPVYSGISLGPPVSLLLCLPASTFPLQMISNLLLHLSALRFLWALLSFMPVYSGILLQSLFCLPLHFLVADDFLTCSFYLSLYACLFWKYLLNFMPVSPPVSLLCLPLHFLVADDFLTCSFYLSALRFSLGLAQLYASLCLSILEYSPPVSLLCLPLHFLFADDFVTRSFYLSALRFSLGLAQLYAYSLWALLSFMPVYSGILSSSLSSLPALHFLVDDFLLLLFDILFWAFCLLPSVLCCSEISSLGLAHFLVADDFLCLSILESLSSSLFSLPALHFLVADDFLTCSFYLSALKEILSGPCSFMPCLFWNTLLQSLFLPASSISLVADDFLTFPSTYSLGLAQLYACLFWNTLLQSLFLCLPLHFLVADDFLGPAPSTCLLLRFSLGLAQLYAYSLWALLSSLCLSIPGILSSSLSWASQPPISFQMISNPLLLPVCSDDFLDSLWALLSFMPVYSGILSSSLSSLPASTFPHSLEDSPCSQLYACLFWNTPPVSLLCLPLHFLFADDFVTSLLLPVCSEILSGPCSAPPVYACLFWNFLQSPLLDTFSSSQMISSFLLPVCSEILSGPCSAFMPVYSEILSSVSLLCLPLHFLFADDFLTPPFYLSALRFSLGLALYAYFSGPCSTLCPSILKYSPLVSLLCLPLYISSSQMISSPLPFYLSALRFSLGLAALCLSILVSLLCHHFLFIDNFACLLTFLSGPCSQMISACLYISSLISSPLLLPVCSEILSGPCSALCLSILKYSPPVSLLCLPLHFLFADDFVTRSFYLSALRFSLGLAQLYAFSLLCLPLHFLFADDFLTRSFYLSALRFSLGLAQLYAYSLWALLSFMPVYSEILSSSLSSLPASTFPSSQMISSLAPSTPVCSEISLGPCSCFMPVYSEILSSSLSSLPLHFLSQMPASLLPVCSEISLGLAQLYACLFEILSSSLSSLPLHFSFADDFVTPPSTFSLLCLPLHFLFADDFLTRSFYLSALRFSLGLAQLYACLFWNTLLQSLFSACLYISSSQMIS